MYRLPWSRTDNPGGWVEVTDACDLACPGCYRLKLGGHVPIDQVKSEVVKLKRWLNCDGIAIAGGEPLLYPQIVEVVDYIRRQGLKPRLLTNGQNLTWDLAKALKKAGLTNISFHVDSRQNRVGWEGKTEADMNWLRQTYADLIWELGGVGCSFLTTVYRSTLAEIPDILAWARDNVPKVSSVALITLRGLPLSAGTAYLVNDERIDLSNLGTAYTDTREISVMAEDVYDVIEQGFPGSHPSAYLNGTGIPESFKILVIPYLGSKRGIFGRVGPKTIEFSQVMHHLLKGRYYLGLKKLTTGKEIFLMSQADPEVRHAWRAWLRSGLRNPVRFFEPLYVQTIQIQQPKEILDGETNTCDGCLNQMIYNGRLINSCRLDEYRLYGGPLEPLTVSR
jgi:hypothetical protein